MKLLLAIIMILGGLVLGAYVGIWLCFIGGIVDVIGAIRAPELVAIDVAIGVGKFVFSGIAGTLCMYCLLIPGMVLLSD